MVLESIIPPSGDKFSDRALEAIQEEIGYWNAGTVLITRSKKVSTFPIPVNLFRRQKNGKTEEYDNFGLSLIERELANFGEVDLFHPDYKLHARGIDAA